MTAWRTFLAGAGSALLAACAGPGQLDDGLTLEQRLAKSGYRQGESMVRIPGFGLSGWNYLDDDHIQVGSGPGNEYLLTFASPCRELQTVGSIAYSTTAGSLSRFDRIFARDMGYPVNCAIREIHKLEKLPR